jgi:hypothetical protein
MTNFSLGMACESAPQPATFTERDVEATRVRLLTCYR